MCRVVENYLELLAKMVKNTKMQYPEDEIAMEKVVKHNL